MYLTASLFASLARASRIRFSAPLSSSISRTSSPSSFPPPSHSRSLSYSTAYRSLRSSAPRWSHGYDWRSPVSLKAQIRSSAPVIERFERKLATMASEHAFKGILTTLPNPEGGEFGKYYSLAALNDSRVDKLPYSIKILLESAIRNCDNFQVTKEDVEKIIDWEIMDLKQADVCSVSDGRKKQMNIDF